MPQQLIIKTNRKTVIFLVIIVYARQLREHQTRHYLCVNRVTGISWLKKKICAGAFIYFILFFFLHNIQNQKKHKNTLNVCDIIKMCNTLVTHSLHSVRVFFFIFSTTHVPMPKLMPMHIHISLCVLFQHINGTVCFAVIHLTNK